MDRNCLDVLSLTQSLVAPRRGAWIEILIASLMEYSYAVAPRRGAWIEILDY